MYKIGIKPKLAEFREDLIRTEFNLEKVAYEGFKKAMLEFFNDVRDKPPSCPVRSGFLYDQHEMLIIPISGGYKGVVQVKGVPYAIFVHEGINRWGKIQNWTRPGSGPFWISSKGIQYEPKYAGIIEKHIDEVISRWRR